MNLVFVYGSLMRGFGNHVLLEEATFVSSASVEGFSLYSLGPFPGAAPSDGDASPIVGEVYEVDDETLFKRLDRLEGHPHFYERQKVEVYCDNMSGNLPCWMYVYQHDVKEPVPNGDWREYATSSKTSPLRN